MEELLHLFIDRRIRRRRSVQGGLYVASGCTILVAMLLHLFWFSYFWGQDVVRLVVANGMGILLMLVLFLFNRLGGVDFAATAFTVVLVLYSALATVTTGWDAGCQWLILCALLPHFLYLPTSTGKKTWLALFSLAFLLVGYFITHARMDDYGDMDYVVLRFVNTLLVFGFPLAQVLAADALRRGGR